jgi:hypothetical protein
VKEQLAQQWRGRSQAAAATSSLLTGRIFDDRGHRMSPVHTQKGGARYRYYVSCALAQGRKDEADSVSRVPAPEIEAVILKALRDCTRSSEEHCQAQGCCEQELVAALVDRVVVQKKELTLTLRAPAGSEGSHTLALPWSPAPHHRRRQVIAPSPADGPPPRPKPIRAEARARLIEAIAKARSWLEEITSNEEVTTLVIAQREGCSERSVRLTLSLAFLAPGLVQAAIHGTLPHGAGLSALAELPPSWQDQYDHIRLG